MQEFENILENVEAAAKKDLEPMDITPYFVDFTKEAEKPIAVISDAANPDRIIVSEQNLFVIAGEAKSRKSFLASLLVIEFFQQHPDKKAILIDTEQAEWNVTNVARRVCRGMGWDYAEAYKSKRLQVAHLRPYTKAQRLSIVEQIIAQEKPYLCIVDGARDLVQSINDDTECSALVDKFLKWSEVYTCAIGTVLHTNKDGETVRGHVGSEFINKAETTLFCKKKDAKRTTVSSYRARNVDIDTFDFEVNEKIVPVRVGATPQPLKCGTAKETEALNALQIKEASRDEWINEIRTISACAKSTAETWFNHYVREGYLRKCLRNGEFYGHFKLYGNEPLKLWPQTEATLPLDNNQIDDNNQLPF